MASNLGRQKGGARRALGSPGQEIIENLRLGNFTLLILMRVRSNSNSGFAIRNAGVEGWRREMGAMGGMTALKESFWRTDPLLGADGCLPRELSVKRTTDDNVLVTSLQA